MTKSGSLWAIGYDDTERANQVRDDIVNLGWDKRHCQVNRSQPHSTSICCGHDFFAC